MFHRFLTLFALPLLIQGSWSLVTAPSAASRPTLSTEAQQYAQQWNRRPSSRQWNRRPSYGRPSYGRPVQRTSRPRRRLQFRVGVRRSYRRSFYAGGIARDPQCPSNASQLARLVPPAFENETQANEKSLPTDRTMAARPTFFAFLPELASGLAEITLQRADQQGGDIFKGEFQTSGEAGIVGLQLPETAPALEIGEAYLWQIAIQCDPEEDDERWLSVEGWIERIPAPGLGMTDEAESTNEAELTDEAEFYASQGIWQDVLGFMTQLRYENPEDPLLAEEWAELMETAGLPEFSQTPVSHVIIPTQVVP